MNKPLQTPSPQISLRICFSNIVLGSEEELQDFKSYLANVVLQSLKDYGIDSSVAMVDLYFYEK